jgi:hypothetical protein
MANDALVKGALPIRTYEQFKTIDQQVTEVGATAEALPATAMTNRKGIFIYNAEAAGTGVYLGNSDVTADETAGTGGFLLDGGNTMFLTLDGSCTIYAISGGSVTVHTLEVT